MCGVGGSVVQRLGRGNVIGELQEAKLFMCLLDSGLTFHCIPDLCARALLASLSTLFEI